MRKRPKLVINKNKAIILIIKKKNAIIQNNIPALVLTHDASVEVPKGKTSFTFVTEDIESPIEQAKNATGNKMVNVIGGAQTIQNNT